MNRKQRIIQASISQPHPADILLTDQDHELLQRHDTSYKKYINDPAPTFVILNDKAEARRLSDLCDRLEPIRMATARGAIENNKKVVLILIHEP